MEVLILGVYLEIFFFRITWSKIRVRIIHGRALYTGKYGIIFVGIPQGSSLVKVVKFILFKKSIICNNVYILAPSRHATIINCSQWRNASSDPRMIVKWQVRKVLRLYPTYITLEMLRGFGLKGDLTETGNRP